MSWRYLFQTSDGASVDKRGVSQEPYLMEDWVVPAQQQEGREYLEITGPTGHRISCRYALGTQALCAAAAACLCCASHGNG